MNGCGALCSVQPQGSETKLTRKYNQDKTKLRNNQKRNSREVKNWEGNEKSYFFRIRMKPIIKPAASTKTAFYNIINPLMKNFSIYT